MVRRLVLTGWAGVAFAEIASSTLPLLSRYATKHGAMIGSANLASFDAPPSWMKITFMASALKDFDSVLWVDADVVVADSSQNIFEEIDPEAWQSLVVHHTECGEVPNCGVWHVTKQMLPTLTRCWEDLRPVYERHPWWEQAALMTEMGYSVTAAPHGEKVLETPLSQRTQFLDAKWNHHPRDRHRVESPAFRHVTQYADRLGEVRRLCAQAT